MQEVLRRRRQVQEQVGKSRSTIYRLIGLGKFPKPVSISGPAGGKSVFWLQSEIDAWIQARIAERDAA